VVGVKTVPSLFLLKYGQDIWMTPLGPKLAQLWQRLLPKLVLLAVPEVPINEVEKSGLPETDISELFKAIWSHLVYFEATWVDRIGNMHSIQCQT
jgi:hypothetical protein